MDTTGKGRKGETIAASYLENDGYKVIKRNFRAYGGEIDIVAVKDDITAFVEVKYWDVFGFREMERTLDYRKKARILRASKGFLDRYPVFSRNSVRFDLLYLSDSGKQVEHVTDAFTETDYS